MSTVQVKLKNGNVMNVKEGSQAHKTYANSVVSNAGTQQQISNQNTANNQARVQQPQQQYQTIQSPQTGMSSTNSNSNNSGWANQQSSIQVNGQNVNNAQAYQANPLQGVNDQRQKLISEANKTGNWDAYRAFEAQQSPLHYENGAQNKNYYANQIETAYNAMQKAQQSGDSFTAGEWERTLQQELDKYRNAPGMNQYIAGINNTSELASQYGINQAGSDYFNSIYNNQGVRDNGYYGSQMWYDNPAFLDETTRNNTAGALGMSGTDFNQNAFNLDSMMQAYAQNQAGLIPFAQWAQQTGWQDPRQQAVAQYQQGQVANQGGTVKPVAPERSLGHVYAPGQTANETGYKENQEVNNDLYEQYLKRILTGGF